MEQGETVTATKGKLKAVFERNTGTNEHGNWSIQNVIISDGDVEMKVKVCDRESAIPSAWKGKLIYLTSLNGDKGITGLKVKEDTYKGKTSKILSATKTAEIGLQDAEADAAAPHPEPVTPAAAPTPTPTRRAEPEPEHPRASSPAPAQAPARPAAAAPGSDADFRSEVLKTRAFLGTQINLIGLCIDAAVAMVKMKNEQHGLSFDSEQIEKFAVHMSIKCERKGIGEGLPSGKLDKYLPPKPAAPAPADQQD